MVYCSSARNANVFLSFISFSSTQSRRSSSANGLGKQFLIQSYDRRYSNGCLLGASIWVFLVQAARLFGPPTRFDASKLKVMFVGDDTEKQALDAATRAYTLTHCDFTAKLTLVVSNRINNKKLRERQTTLQKDDVVAEWNIIKDELSLHVHCFISGANLFQKLAAGFRYHIFSKELPLVLQAVVHGDAVLLADQPELMDSKVWVYFHSESKEYNRIECWGPLKDAIQIVLDDIHIVLDDQVKIETLIRATKLSLSD
ncbi:hypothetical protein IEQ34_003033 [Dendrobium chrysotoxum]|uniref:Staygreen protein domain-containing protein n=1 Tax=Dendrobium chrysotoxum TaxID=161865 RepID=A0AAV7H1N3_DENCH|nr:hypothetical protein IEQ34_003033 [Dendrobium chrysotoxum]